MRFLVLFIFALNHAFAVGEVAQTFSYQGRLFNSAGTSPSTDNVSIIFSIYAPTGNECLLYRERQTADLSLTDGFYSFNIGSFIGSPKRYLDPGLTMAQVFGSRAVALRSPMSPDCAAGYTPAPGDERRLRVSLSRNSGAYLDMTPDQTLTSATQAVVAQTLQGYAPSDFIMTSTNITQVNAEKLFDGSDAGSLHHHDGRYFAPSTTSRQDLGSAGVYTAGSMGVGTSTAPTSTLVVKGTGATNATSSLNVTDSADASLLFVRNDGNIGIGSSSPANKLTVDAGSFVNANTSTLGSTLMGDATIHQGYLGQRFVLNNSSANFAGFIRAVRTAASTYIGLELGTETNHAIRFLTNGVDDSAERMRINANGNVGIGSSAPALKAHIRGTAATPSTTGAIANGLLLLDGSNGEGLVFGMDPLTPWGGWIQAQNYNNTANVRPISLNPVGGYVGIGTKSPTTILTMPGNNAITFLGASAQNQPVSFGTSSLDIGYINFGGGSGKSFQIQSDGSPVATFNTASNGHSMAGFMTHTMNTTSTGLTLTQSGTGHAAAFMGGNIGVGTLTPAETMEVSGGARLGKAPATLTTVNGAHLSTDTTITVASTTGYPTSGTLLINGEAMTYRGLTATTFTNVVRGALGTTAVALVHGNTVDNYLTIDQSTSTTPKMVVTGSGNVGIRTAKPAYPLSIQTDNEAFRIFSSNDIHRLKLYGSLGKYIEADYDAQKVFSLHYNANLDSAGGGVEFEYGTRSSLINDANYKATMQFSPRGTTATITSLFLDEVGKVGIGTTAPTTALHVAGPTTIAVPTLTIGRSTDNGRINFDHTAGDTRWRLDYATAKFTIGSPFASKSHLVLDRDTGYVGVNNTSPGYELDVLGNINASGSVTSASDIRLKRDLTPVKDSLGKIGQLSAYNYSWKDTKKFGEKKQLGLVAQEVKKVFPEAVMESKNGYYSVSYSNLVAPLIEAVKELYASIKGHDKQLSVVRAEIASIKKQKDEEIKSLRSENSSMKAYLCQKDPRAPFCKK